MRTHLTFTNIKLIEGLYNASNTHSNILYYLDFITRKIMLCKHVIQS